MAQQTVLVIANAYDCCVACITNDNCGGGFFGTDPNTGAPNQRVFANPGYNPKANVPDGMPYFCDPTNHGGFAYVDVDDNLTVLLQQTVFDGYCGLVEHIRECC